MPPGSAAPTGSASPARQGRPRKVKGYFRERSYEKDGETKTVHNFIVEDLGIERKKVRQRPE